MSEEAFRYEDFVKCPWCLYEHPDSWEMSDGEYDCERCDKPISVLLSHSVTYNTYKAEETK